MTMLLLRSHLASISRRAHFAAVALCCGLLAPLTAWSPNAEAVVAAAVGLPAAPGEARVIVKFKAGAAVLRAHAQAVGSAASSAVVADPESRARALGTRLGLSLRSGVAITGRTQVVVANGVDARALAARLAAEPDVESAAPDWRRHALSAPNDPYYTTGPVDTGTRGGPVSGQWYLQAPSAATASASAVVSSINAGPAWDVTTQASPVVVAVLDSGVRYDHTDLGGGSATAPGGNLLAGYDFVSNATYSNDGDGRDADPSDPGDYITEAEANTAAFLPPTVDTACTPLDPSTGRHVAVDSEWHGTQTTGLIAAVTDNGVGIAGIGRNHVRVLPVRVLGKCGGSDSDIISAMYWAAGISPDAADMSSGISLSGVPANPNPARVISLSLGGGGDCSNYTDVLAALSAKGVLVVAAAGNDGAAVIAPAICPGVVAVAALRQAGTKVSFSNLGPQVVISAPGGNCVNESGACLYPIMSTSNAGTTVPVAGDSSYTDSYEATLGTRSALGTSYSTPMVAGTAALIMAANPLLTSADVLQIIKASARPFPTTGGSTPQIAACADPAQSPGGVTECYCTTSTCGAGMLDAGAAVLAAVGGVQAHITVSTATPQAGQSLSFDAGTSVVASGRSIVGYAWSIASNGGIVSAFTTATNGPTVSILPTGGGTFTVALTVTDSTGATSSVDGMVTVAAAPAAVTPTPTPTTTTSQSSGGGGGALGPEGVVLVALAAYAVQRRRRLACRQRSD